MDAVCRLDRIRTLIRQTFAELGGSSEPPPRETMLIRDGYFCGRRFEAQGWQAVWFIEEDEIKFYDRDGAVTRVVDVRIDRVCAPRRSAA
jgi:hypothetical protein